MRQAIEENFILDVLKGYVPYKTAFNLGTHIEDKKRVSRKQARKALAQWMSLHPTNVTQKVQFIVEHLSKNVAHLLDGKAKAMAAGNRSVTRRAASPAVEGRDRRARTAQPSYNGLAAKPKAAYGRACRKSRLRRYERGSRARPRNPPKRLGAARCRQ
ncbi:hypothetical protein [Methylococcus capsulatus]|uniref:hypothetical protein n=1 Tax=Methylococcus capsulatus TaxID=414 RepID=UPI001C52DB4D|nr:hypothetical protein KW114_10130 [Methylococcus capsulatus]